MKLSLSTILILTAATGMTLACGKKKKSRSDSSEAPTEQPQQQPQEEQKDEEQKDEKKNDTPENTALYQPANLPAKFSLQFPGSLAIDVGEGAALCLDDEPCGGDGYDAPMAEPAPDAAAPTKDQSHGLSELRYQMDNIRWRIKDYTQTFSTVDNVIEANKADCADGCDLKDAKAKITKEMVNLMIDNSGGKKAFNADELAQMNELVGQEYPIGDVVVEHPTANVDGFTTIITITNNYGETDKHMIALSFAKADSVYSKVRVKENSEGSYDMGGSDAAEAVSEPSPALTDEAPAAGQVESFSTDFQLDFDAVAQSLAVADNSDWSGYKYKNSFKFAADPAKAALHGTTFSVVIDQSDDQGKGYAQSTTGYADDAGAYLETVYSYDETQADYALSGAIEEEKHYELFLGDDVTADALNADPYAYWSVGSFDSYGEYYYGPMPAPAAAEFKVFEVTWGVAQPAMNLDDDPNNDLPAEEWKQTYAASSLTVTAIDTTTTRHTSGYSEQIDATGQLLAYCYYDDVVDGKLGDATFCSSGWSDDSAYAEAYTSYEGEDGSFEVKGSIVASLSGVDIDVLKGMEFYVVRKQANIDTFANQLKTAWFAEDGDSSAVWDQLIGYGTYIGDPEVPATGEATGMYSINFWGSTESAADAQILLLTYDADYNLTFLPVGGAINAKVVE